MRGEARSEKRGARRRTGRRGSLLLFFLCFLLLASCFLLRVRHHRRGAVAPGGDRDADGGHVGIVGQCGGPGGLWAHDELRHHGGVDARDGAGGRGRATGGRCGRSPMHTRYPSHSAYGTDHRPDRQYPLPLPCDQWRARWAQITPFARTKRVAPGASSTCSDPRYWRLGQDEKRAMPLKPSPPTISSCRAIWRRCPSTTNIACISRTIMAVQEHRALRRPGQS